MVVVLVVGFIYGGPLARGLITGPRALSPTVRLARSTTGGLEENT